MSIRAKSTLQAKAHSSQSAKQPPEVGAVLQKLRLARNLTLEDLSRAAGVSKSMLSQIEREKANPTIAVAWRLASALDVEMSQLLSSNPPAAPHIRLLEPHEMPTLSEEQMGYSLKILGPMELAGQYEWYELSLKANGCLSSKPHDPGTFEHLTVIQGNMELEVEGEKKKLKCGATARYQADKAHVIRNHGKTEARAIMVVIHR